MRAPRTLALVFAIGLSAATGTIGHALRSATVNASNEFDLTRLRLLAIGWLFFGGAVALAIRVQALHPLSYGLTAGLLIAANIPLFLDSPSIDAWDWLALRVGGEWSLICAGMFGFAAFHRSRERARFLPTRGDSLADVVGRVGRER